MFLRDYLVNESTLPPERGIRSLKVNELLRNFFAQCRGDATGVAGVSPPLSIAKRKKIKKEGENEKNQEKTRGKTQHNDMNTVFKRVKTDEFLRG